MKRMQHRCSSCGSRSSSRQWAAVGFTQGTAWWYRWKMCPLREGRKRIMQVASGSISERCYCVARGRKSLCPEKSRPPEAEVETRFRGVGTP